MATEVHNQGQNKPKTKLKRGLVDDDYTSDEEVPDIKPKIEKIDRSRHCPYLDTIDRTVLDFDFEKLCSVSLSHLNVYACLVCGKYFQGRGQNSHAYTHSVHIGHHVYLNLRSLKFYCLPDNYEIIDSSLEDIKYVLKPTFGKEHIKLLDTTGKVSRALNGNTYIPGIVGLNNIKANDYLNVVLQALAFVPPVRNYFLCDENYKDTKRPPGDTMFPLVQRFGELVRKIWNPRNFKTHVSPHEMLQAVVSCSKKKFQFTEQGDPIEFLSWFLNGIHLTLNGTKKARSSVIYKSFRGEMKQWSRKLPQTDDKALEEKILQQEEYKETEQTLPFLYLTLDIPASPLFKDELEQNAIPQVPLINLLQKFNGVQEKEYKTYYDVTVKKFVLTKLPKYLILFIKRFTNNTFFVEKNPTIINFPVKDLDMSEYLSSEPSVQEANKHRCYDLVANISHGGEFISDKRDSSKGTYQVHVLHKGSKQWHELQDLHVKDILPPMITLSESYIQIWELQKNSSK
ncbi:U4/U6.U5 tri-snRNP-associated protein 2-like [Hydractinia symbiolongicarpus]|uniref:U4/U6.U5 tri-snRNP-associated protein 2-like n=1 Tax=Hydractinia symbiolongicarpus TaxID=13093 RepID=UPI00254FE88C|nr:U4/U6.U5 tri-snRNP-associated protein 2-like [Hydractinia symbiolongicarpus]